MAAHMKSMSLKKRKLEDLSMDEFMMADMESSGSESDKVAKKTKRKGLALVRKTKVVELKKSAPKSKKPQQQKKGVVSGHKASLDTLKDQDPEFYKFLKNEDESLLQFADLSGSDVTDTSDDEDDDTSKSADAENDDDGDDDIDLPESSDDEETDAGKNKTKSAKGVKAQQKEQSKNKKKKPDAANEEKKKKGLKKKQAEEENEEDSDNEAGEVDWDLEGSDDDSDDGRHVPGDTLEEMSDSEDEGDEEGSDEEKKKKTPGTLVTMKMVKGWEERFKAAPSVALIHEVAQAFRAAVQQTTTKTGSTKYLVQGGKVFNGVVRLCLLEMWPALRRVLDLPDTQDLQKPALPSGQNKRWKKMKVDVKFYLTDALQLLTSLSEESMVNIVLKHLHKMVTFYAFFSKLNKSLIKRLITIWSEGQETTRVLAFLCINRIIRARQEDMMENCLKQMYMAYVKNCKFTSPTALPMINFMQRSFVEVLSLDFGLAYQYAFMYIRQLAIHLRSAVSTKKKESCQAVYNWQFVHCLGLWSRVLSLTHPNEVLEPLIYPLVQITIGTIKLIPTARYYPLRFHCVRNLTMISRATNTFIPVLPFLLEKNDEEIE